MASKDTPQETPDGREAKGRGFRVLLVSRAAPPPPLSQHSSLPSPHPRRSRCWNNPEVPELGEFFDRGGGAGWGAPVFGNIAGLARLLRNLESVSKVLGGGGKRGAWGFFLFEVMEIVWNEQ